MEWPTPSAIAVYGKDAAKTLTARGCPVPCGTIYSLAWPHVKAATGARHTGGRRKKRDYQRRVMHDVHDSAAEEWLKTAPSRQPKSDRLEALHAWSPGNGPLPEWVLEDKDNHKTGERFAATLAEWLDMGAPLTSAPYQFLAIDEAQDMSHLEMAAAKALVCRHGEILAVGDPGQAIFISNKGVPDNELPPAWQLADSTEYLNTGYRVGNPAASTAARILAPYFNRPAENFAAEGRLTQFHLWDMEPPPMDRNAFIMATSRQRADTYAKNNGMIGHGLIPGLTERTTCGTIHSCKGHEADHVYLLPWKDYEDLEANNPSALKLMYVALTRAKHHIHIPLDMAVALGVQL